MRQMFQILIAVSAVLLHLAGPGTALAGPAMTDSQYYDGFLDLSGLDPFRSADVELDALGGVRMRGSGASQPGLWTDQAHFLASTFYVPTLFVDNPPIPLATFDAASQPGSLVLPSTQYAFRRASQDPVLLAAPPASVDGYSVGGMCVRRVGLDSSYYMWYTGVPENERVPRLYLAKSNDGVAWVHYQKIENSVEVPVLDVGEPGTFDARGIGKPSVIYDAAATPKFRMWYSAEGDLTGSIGYATSDDGINWTKWVQPILVLDGSGGDDVGPHASLALGADGIPIAAYYDVTNADLKFVRCGNASCTKGNTVLTLDSEGDVGRYASLAVAGDGLPVIGYYDADHGDLKVLHCGTAACTVGNIVTVLDGAGGEDVGLHVSLKADANGYPVVAYYDADNGDLKVVGCTDYGCTGGDEVPSVVDGAAGTDVGRHASLGFVVTDPFNPATSRFPAIAYYDASNGDLRLAVCNDVACAGADETLTTLDGSGGPDVGRNASLAIGPTGLPVIAYYDATNLNLALIACNDRVCAGGDDLPAVLRAGIGTPGGPVNLAAGFSPAGLPIVVHYDAVNADLALVSCNDAACSGGDESTETLDADGDVGQHLSLAATLAATPLIAYYDATHGDLKLAPTERRPTPVLEAGPIGGIDSFSVSHPSVMQILDAAGDYYRMWYTANDSNNRRIAYAQSYDGITWARGGLVVDVGNTANDSLGAWSPSVTRNDTGGFAMVYTGWKTVSGGMTVQAKLLTADSPDGTTWTKGNVALNTGNSSSFDGTNLSQGSILYDPLDGAAPYKMWYVGNTVDANGNFHDRIGLATKGLTGTWGKVAGSGGLNSVLGLGTQGAAFDSLNAFDLRVVPDPSTTGTLLGFFSGTNASDFKERIGVRQSDDGGLTWTDHASADPLVGVGGSGAFDEGGVLTPAPLHTGAGWLIYHTALNAARSPVIALHTATTDLSSTAAGPVVLGAGAGFEAGGCADPFLVADGATLTMFYAGRSSGGIWSIGRATGAVGTPQTFTGRTQVLAPGPGAHDQRGVRRPVVWKDPATNSWHLWYTAIGSDAVERIAHATSPDGIAWTKDGLALTPSTSPYDFAEKGVWPAAAWLGTDGTSLYQAVTGVDRFGWRRTGLLAAAGSGVVDGATATYQYPDNATLFSPGYQPRDWRQISWTPSAEPEGTTLEVWVSYYPTSSNLWSNFFRIPNGADLPFLLSVKGMRWQVRAAGHAADATLTPRLDDLAVDNAPIAFPAAATAATIPVGPAEGWYLLGWQSLTVKSDIPGSGALAVALADQEGTSLVAAQPVDGGTWIADLSGVPGTSGRLQLFFGFTPDSGSSPPRTPLLKSVDVAFRSTRTPSALTLTAAPNPVLLGEPMTLSGWLMSGTTPLGGQDLTLKYRAVSATSYTVHPNPVVTETDGSFTVPDLLQTEDTIYRAEWAGGDLDGTGPGPEYPPAVGSFTVQMAPVLLTLTATPNPLPYNQTVTLSGSLTSGVRILAGQNLVLRHRPLRGTAFTVHPTPLVTGPDGSFSVSLAQSDDTVYVVEWGGWGVTGYSTPAATQTVTVLMPAAALAFRAAVNPIIYGRLPALRGSLSSQGVPLAGRSILIRARPVTRTAFANVKTVVTDALGNFALTPGTKPLLNTVYRAEFGTKAARQFTLGVRAVVSLRVAGYASRAGRYYRYPLRKAVVAYGSVSPKHYRLGDGVTSGKAVVRVFQYRYSRTQRKYVWVRIKSVATLLNTRSAYRWSWTPAVRGRYRVQTIFRADKDHYSGKSPDRYVQVY